jgi:hypothetical protein
MFVYQLVILHNIGGKIHYCHDDVFFLEIDAIKEGKRRCTVKTMQYKILIIEVKGGGKNESGI